MHRALTDFAKDRRHRVISRRYGITFSTLYRWAQLYEGCSVAQIQFFLDRARATQLLRYRLSRARSQMDVLVPLVVRLVPNRRERVALAREAVATKGMPREVACRTFSISKCCYLYELKVRDRSREERELLALHSVHPTWGQPKMWAWLKAHKSSMGFRVFAKLYRKLGLMQKRVKPPKPRWYKKRSIPIPAAPNHTWSMDLKIHFLRGHRRYWTLLVLDDFNREGLSALVEKRLTSPMVMAELQRVCATRGLPSRIRCDNGPHFTSKEIRTWARKVGVTLFYIPPARPIHNALVERFIRSYKREVLQGRYFDTITGAQRAAHRWLRIYNNERGHAALRMKTPRAYLAFKGYDLPDMSSR